MEVITKKTLINTVADRWNDQYRHDKTKQEIYTNLTLLNNPTEDQIAATIGNGSWTRNKCDECEKDSDITVRFRDELNYGSNTIFVCSDCLEEAVVLARQVQNGTKV